VLVAWALAAHPLLAVVSGRPWPQAEVFGLAPDPTAIATLGWLLWTDRASRGTRLLTGAARAVAIAWCAISGATLLTMGAAQACVPLSAALVAAFASATDSGRRGRFTASL
jgi:hypothetical protein